MGVDDDTDRQRRERSQVVTNLGGLAVRDPGVDEEHALVAEDDADVLVVERVAPDEDPIADLRPARHGPQRSVVEACRC